MGLIHDGPFYRFLWIMLCGDISTEMVEYEICFLTSALSHFGVYFDHVEDNISEDRSQCTYRAGTFC